MDREDGKDTGESTFCMHTLIHLGSQSRLCLSVYLPIYLHITLSQVLRSQKYSEFSGRRGSNVRK